MAPHGNPRLALLLALGLASGCSRPDTPTAPATGPLAGEADRITAAQRRIRHVLLISVDGLHAVDLSRFVAGHPASALAQLSRQGTTFSNASTAKPSDSYPGLLAIITGGSPRSTGVFYDDSYDRALSPPGSNCSTVGTEVVYDESIDIDPTALNGGGGIDPAALPRDPSRGCSPVYPHQFLRVNTIFEVIKAAGMRTAWSDKHPSYELVNGPSGTGVDDLFTPEIAATLPNGGVAADNVANAETYDAIKVQAVVNEIDGKDHTGTVAVGVPAILGMNFQAVSVGQKTAGYLDGTGTPSPALLNALEFVDASLGRMVSELKRGGEGLFESTAIIVSAKHGQSPIDPTQRRIVNKNLIPGIVNGVQAGLLAQGTEDDVALLWLTDQSRTAAVVSALGGSLGPAGIATILSGGSLTTFFNNPLTDTRTPDVVVLVQTGVIYAKLSATKLAEHGGFGPFDTGVPILVSGAGMRGGVVNTPVATAQIAPTILELLGLNPAALQAVQLEGTQTLPLFAP